MRYRIQRHPDATAFLARAEPWLLRAEAENNLVLAIARGLTASLGAYELPLYLATVEADGEVVGCAWRTPPFKLGLTHMPEAALPLLVADLADVYPSLPAVLGPEPEAETFARLWAELWGVSTRPGMHQRIYRLDEVQPLADVPPGRLRPATDADLLTEWIAAFRAEADATGPGAREWAEKRIRNGTVYLWQDTQPVTMVGVAGRTPNGARVGPVYTPPEQRRRGYGTAATAALSRQMLDDGARFCFLYTDLANPTSNGIYRRIGYRPVIDVVDWTFDSD